MDTTNECRLLAEYRSGQFSWYLEEDLNNYAGPLYRYYIGGGTMKRYEILKEVIVRTCTNGEVHIILKNRYDWHEEEPREYDEAGKEGLRSLLRHLGYKKAKEWKWTLDEYWTAKGIE